MLLIQDDGRTAAGAVRCASARGVPFERAMPTPLAEASVGGLADVVQLGAPPVVRRPVAAPVAHLPPVIELAVGGAFACARTAALQVLC